MTEITQISKLDPLPKSGSSNTVSTPLATTQFDDLLKSSLYHHATDAPPETQEIEGPNQFGVMERAIDAAGKIIPGLFRMRYADGSFSQADDVNAIDDLRRQSLDQIKPQITLSTEEYLRGIEKKVLRNDATLTVVDIIKGPNEKFGNDMVLMTFADETRTVTQKAFYEAAESLDAFDTIMSQEDFSNWHIKTWASKINSDERFASAHEQFSLSQAYYNSQIEISDHDKQTLELLQSLNKVA